MGLEGAAAASVAAESNLTLEETVAAQAHELEQLREALQKVKQLSKKRIQLLLDTHEGEIEEWREKQTKVRHATPHHRFSCCHLTNLTASRLTPMPKCCIAWPSRKMKRPKCCKCDGRSRLSCR